MKSTIGVYNSHNEAINALKELKTAGISEQKLSLLGRAEKVDDQVYIGNTNMMKVAGTEVGTGAVLGSTLGILTGVGIFAIPGLGFLYGAGALVGAIAGFDIGLIGGGIFSALTINGVKDDDAKTYENYIKEGKTLLIAQGTEEEIKNIKQVLEKHNNHTALAEYK